MGHMEDGFRGALSNMGVFRRNWYRDCFAEYVPERTSEAQHMVGCDRTACYSGKVSDVNGIRKS
ncbi:hypothetical protein ACTNEW_10090 [Blautia sp. HCP3S3_G3]|uniref:hypothetical protein n=1 Tax=Blautia sp. HCP3S3_G3 TaxID=3438913 RepID=UPI003F8A74D1